MRVDREKIVENSQQKKNKNWLLEDEAWNILGEGIERS